MDKQQVEFVTYHGTEFIKVTGDHGVGYVPTSMPLDAMINFRDKLLRKLAGSRRIPRVKSERASAKE
jgi:hypothetical protein